MSLPSNKPAPQKDSIVRDLTVLLAYDYFKYPDFKMSPYNTGRFKIFLEQCRREGKIMTGHWHRRTWIRFAILSHLVSSSLSLHIQHSTNNWDIPIAKCISVVLVASLSARSGDVAWSNLYKAQEHLRYHQIHLHRGGHHVNRHCSY